MTMKIEYLAETAFLVLDNIRVNIAAIISIEYTNPIVIKCYDEEDVILNGDYEQNKAMLDSLFHPKGTK